MHKICTQNNTISVLSFLLIIGFSNVPAQAQTYSLTDLGTLGGNNSSANGVNNLGQVTGYASTSLGLTDAFLSGSNGGALKDLGTLGGSGSVGQAVNDKGQVTGYSDVNGYTRAFLSDVNGGALTNLGGLGGSYSYGGGINAQGQVAGDSATPLDAADHVFLSGPDGAPLSDSGTLSGAYHINVAGLNNAGQITGYYDNGQTEAYISAPGGGALRSLGTLPGGSRSYAGGINASGQVVGTQMWELMVFPLQGFMPSSPNQMVEHWSI